MFDPQRPAETTAQREARHLRMLRELAEIGMDLARAVQRQANDPAPAEGDAAPADLTDLGLVFSRIGRAVRQTLALEARLVEVGRERERDADLFDHHRQANEARRAIRRKDEARRLVEQAIEAEAGEGDVEQLLADLHERLEDPDDTADFADRPMGVLIARICRDLGVAPDWSLWEDQEWAIDEAAAKPRGSPFALSPTPSSGLSPGPRSADDERLPLRGGGPLQPSGSA